MARAEMTRGMSAVELVSKREQELIDLGAKKERARLLSVLMRHRIIEIKDGVIRVPTEVSLWDDAPYLQAEIGGEIH